MATDRRPTTTGRSSPHGVRPGSGLFDCATAGDPSLAASTPPVGDGSRGRLWASTMHGHPSSGPTTVAAHADSNTSLGSVEVFGREAREASEDAFLAPGATRAMGAGTRRADEAPDPIRTCFERDRDRILHSTSFRRLAGKTQVFVFPADHQRTRLTHALEVAQVATAVARALRLNTLLTEAIALGHDCGHGPGGHPSEEAFAPYLPGGYDHAVFGADVTLGPLNLTAEVLDGIRNHSWSRPAPSTPEAEVLSWADRCAYCAHDLEDAVAAGVVNLDELPSVVRERCGVHRGAQLNAFVGDLVATSARTGTIGMSVDMAEALGALRAFNYERIYTRPESVAQGVVVVRLLTALVEHFISDAEFARQTAAAGGPPGSTVAAVGYVAGMTDRFACDLAVRLLAWPLEDLPHGFDVPGGG